MAKRKLSEREILAQLPAAHARTQRAKAAEPHAADASYDRKTGTLRVSLTNGGSFAVPIVLLPELRGLSDHDLGAVEVGAAGVGLRWPRFDIDMSVIGIARAALGSTLLSRVAGSAGGAARTRAKAEAARRNGAKGGRPRKTGTGSQVPDARRRADSYTSSAHPNVRKSRR